MRLDELWRGQAQNNRPHVAAAVQPSPVMVQVETNVGQYSIKKLSSGSH